LWAQLSANPLAGVPAMFFGDFTLFRYRFSLAMIFIAIATTFACARQAETVVDFGSQSEIRQVIGSKSYVAAWAWYTSPFRQRAVVCDRSGKILQEIPVDSKGSISQILLSEALRLCILIQGWPSKTPIRGEGSSVETYARAYDVFTGRMAWQARVNESPHSISPDGLHLLPSSTDYQANPATPHGIYVLDLRDGRRHQLDSIPDGSYAAWLDTNHIIAAIQDHESRPQDKPGQTTGTRFIVVDAESDHVLIDSMVHSSDGQQLCFSAPAERGVLSVDPATRNVFLNSRKAGTPGTTSFLTIFGSDLKIRASIPFDGSMLRLIAEDETHFLVPRGGSLHAVDEESGTVDMRPFVHTSIGDVIPDQAFHQQYGEFTKTILRNVRIVAKPGRITFQDTTIH
jgi:hypothetical protein